MTIKVNASLRLPPPPCSELLQSFINRPLACFWHRLSKKPFAHLMKGELSHSASSAERWDSAATAPHFFLLIHLRPVRRVNATQTFQRTEKWISKVYRHKNLPADKTAGRKAYLLRLCHPELAFASFSVEFLDVSGSAGAVLIQSVDVNGCVFVQQTKLFNQGGEPRACGHRWASQDWSFPSNRPSSLICYTG